RNRGDACGRDDLLERPVVRVDQRKGPDLLIVAIGEDDCFRQVAVEHLVTGESLREAWIVDGGLTKVPGEIRACSGRFVFDPLNLPVIACTSDLDGILEHPACAVRKPELEAAL